MGRSTAARGYGGAHQAMRAVVAELVAAGGAVCARCGLPIVPGAAWDLGHTDDRRSWSGPEHAACNRRAGAGRGALLRRWRHVDPGPPAGW